MHAYTGTHESAIVKGRTAKVWPSGAIEIHQDGEFLYETRISKNASELDLEYTMAAEKETGALSAANCIKFNLLTRFAETKSESSRWDRKVWVPVSKVHQVEISLGDARRIARAVNNRRVALRGGYNSDAAALLRELRSGVLAEFEITLKEAGVVTNWYADNVYDPNDRATLI